MDVVGDENDVVVDVDDLGGVLVEGMSVYDYMLFVRAYYVGSIIDVCALAK